jgi:hypothetical protein
MASHEAAIATIDNAFLSMEAKNLGDMVKSLQYAIEQGKPELVDYTLWKIIANAEGTRRMVRSVARNAGDTELLKRLQVAGVGGYEEAYNGEHSATA